MGTAGDWMSAAFWGMFWAGGMMSLADVLSLIFGGLGFGLGTTFRWRAFHWPLVLFMVATFAGCAVFARMSRRKVRSDPENG